MVIQEVQGTRDWPQQRMSGVPHGVTFGAQAGHEVRIHAQEAAEQAQIQGDLTSEGVKINTYFAEINEVASLRRSNRDGEDITIQKLEAKKQGFRKLLDKVLDKPESVKHYEGEIAKIDEDIEKITKRKTKRMKNKADKEGVEAELFKLAGESIKAAKVKKPAAAGKDYIEIPAGERMPRIKNAMVNGIYSMGADSGMLVHILTTTMGGGRRENDKYTRDEIAYIVFLNYLDYLIDCLNGYDVMGLSDYIFFESLARIIIASIKVNRNNYLLLLDTVFIDLASPSWIDDEKYTFIRNRDFKECVHSAAYNVALQSIGLRYGPMPYDTYKSPQDIRILETDKFKVEFDRISKEAWKIKPFENRKQYIISILMNYIRTLIKPPSEKEGSKSSQVSMSLNLGLKNRGHIDNIVSIGNREWNLNEGITAGGYKTRGLRRKRRNGSPRRKTLRKTRSNR